LAHPVGTGQLTIIYFACLTREMTPTETFKFTPCDIYTTNATEYGMTAYT